MKKKLIAAASALVIFAVATCGKNESAPENKALAEYSLQKKWPTMEQFNAAEKLRSGEREKGIFRLRGNVISKDESGLLVALARGYTDHENTNVFIQEIPIADKLVDGDPIYVSAALSGQTEYTSAVGAKVTVRRFRYVSAPEMPTKAGPNDHSIQHPSF